jgi:hypothetical protein
MRIAAWNVCRLYRAGAVNELVKEMVKYKVYNCTIFYSGHKTDKHKFGKLFYISRYVMDNLLDFEPVHERICKFRVLILNVTI